MADDRIAIVGRWRVVFKDWTWDYTFSGDGSVTWIAANGQTGTGRWAKQGFYINITWFGSETKESFKCPINPANQAGWIDASYGVGLSKATKLPDIPLRTARGASVNPEIANVPWSKYIDQFTDSKYDMNYKIPNVPFAYSSILKLVYDDSTEMEIDFDAELKDIEMNSEVARDSMAQGFLGRGGRIFPKVLSPRTAPRLYALRDDALNKQDQDYRLFAAVAVAGVAWSLSVPAMPVGMAPKPGFSIKSRRIPGVPRNVGTVAGAAVKAGEEVTEATVRAAMKNAPLKTQQGKVSLPIIRRNVQLLREGKTPPPIKVDNGIVVDGNHRYIAGRIVGKEPPIQEWLGGRPNDVVPWDKIFIDLVDWSP